MESRKAAVASASVIASLLRCSGSTCSCFRALWLLPGAQILVWSLVWLLGWRLCASRLRGRSTLAARLWFNGGRCRLLSVVVSVEQIPKLLIVFEILEPIDRLFVMEQNCVQMFERKVFIANQRAQDFLDSERKLLGYALEGDNRNIRVLDVSPNEISPVCGMSIRLVGFKHPLEPGEVRQQN